MNQSRGAARPDRVTYPVAVASAAAAVVASGASGFETSSDPVLLILVAPVVLSAYVGGLGPGLVSTAVVAVGTNISLLSPRGRLSIDAGADATEWIALIILGAMISGLAEASHRSRERLMEVQRTQRATLTSLSEGVIVADPKGVVRYLNPAAERLADIPGEAARGMALRTVLATADIDPVVSDVLRTGRESSLQLADLQLPVAATVTALDRRSGVVVLLQDRSGQVAASAPGVIWSFDLDLRGSPAVTYAGPGFSALFGVAADNLEDIGPQLRERVDERDRAKVCAGLVRAAAARAPWREEFRIDHPERGVRWVVVTATVTVDGERPSWNAFAEDVTEAREAEHLDRERAQLLDLTSDAVFARTADSEQITFWNAGAERLYGIPATDALGRSPHTLLQTVWPNGLETVQLALSETGHWEGELRHRRADGREVVVFSRQAVDRGAARTPHAILEINTDVTEQTRDRERLAQSEDRFRTLVEAAPDLILSVARDGRIQFAGPQARAFGYEPEELVGQPVEVLVPERMREVHRGNRARFAAAPATRSMGAGLPLSARCRDGSEIPVG
jgi:PAS domain S-box-containing protein